MELHTSDLSPHGACFVPLQHTGSAMATSLPTRYWYELRIGNNIFNGSVRFFIDVDGKAYPIESVDNFRKAVFTENGSKLHGYDIADLNVYPPCTENFDDALSVAADPEDTVEEVLGNAKPPPSNLTVKQAQRMSHRIIVVARSPQPTPPTWPSLFDSQNGVPDSGSNYTIENVVIEKSEFVDIRKSNGFLIDKSMLIYDFIRGSSGSSGAAEVCLVLRPRRFGKTLNASMICSFVGPGADRALFRGLAINEHEEFVKQHLGQYACIRISLLSCVSSDWSVHITQIKDLVASVYEQHQSKIQPYLDNVGRSQYNSILEKRSDDGALQSALLKLTNWYYRIYGRKSVIIMDEYDQGMQAAIERVLRQQVNDSSEHNWDTFEMYVQFYRGFLTSTFKDNTNLFRGMLVGVSRVALTGMLSGLNNLYVFAIHSDKFSDKYGFTEEEVRLIYDRFGLQQAGITMNELKAMYNGYTSGTNAPRAIFNPWSIMSMVLNRDATTAHWSATGSLKLVQHVFVASANNELRNQLSQLINNGTITNINIDEGIDYRQFAKQEARAVWGLLYHAGYLTRVLTDTHSRGDAILLRLPNKDVTDYFKSQVNMWYDESRSFTESTTILTKLLNGDVEGFRKSFVDAFQSCTSYHDFTSQANERFYHIFALGFFFAATQRGYNCIESNREAGYGRFDLLVKPASRTAGDRAAVVEFKASENEANLNGDAEKALQQIEEKKYSTQVPDWCTKVDHYGIAFYRKSTCVLSRSYTRVADRSSEWTIC